jgi:hypothetical protein
VEERCSLGKIELWGEDNTVNVPDYLVVRIAQWGPANQIVRRGPGAAGPMPQLVADRAAEIPEQPTNIEAAPALEPVAEPVEQPAEVGQPATDEPGEVLE